MTAMPREDAEKGTELKGIRRVKLTGLDWKIREVRLQDAFQGVVLARG